MVTPNLNKPCLAINGGSAARVEPWCDNFTTGEEEVEAAARAIRSGYLSLFEGSHRPDEPFSFSGGPEVQALEAEWSVAHDISHSISMNSATSGLFASIGALEIGFGDEVIVSPYTMSACALAPLIYGAIPVFADVDPSSGCLDPKSIRANISPRTKAILVVHQFGFPAQMDEIMSIADEFGLSVIEDCAQAHGALYKGKAVGSIGHIGVFSLNVNKSIQSGEGGICVTSDSDLAYRLKLIRNHGEAVVGPAGYQNILNIAGFNYRMTEVTAAIGREQLKKLNILNESRLELVNYLQKKLEGHPWLSALTGLKACENCTCTSGSLCISTYYLTPIRYNAADTSVSRDQFVSTMTEEGILLSAGYVRPLYLQPLYQTKTLFKQGYPFSAPENRYCEQEYLEGICPVAESLHFHDLMTTEHVRPPHGIDDIDNIATALWKAV